MKSFLTRIVLPLCLLALAGCGGGNDAADAGSLLYVGNGAEVQNLDPHVVTGVPEHRVLSALFEGLVDLDPATMNPVPAVAASWQVSQEQCVYTFTIRPEAQWSNGDPLSAQDFCYSWRRMLSPALAAEYAYLLHCLKNAKAYNEGSLTDFSQVGVKALDAQTLEVTLESPTPYFLAMQTHYSWYPVHQKTIETFGAMDERNTKWTRAGNLVSNGPFLLAEWAPNEVIRTVKNPRYWDAQAIALDGINFLPIDNNQTEERSFRTGKLHITNTIPLHKIAVYKKEQPEVLNLHPYCGVYYYRFNTTRKPFNDLRVRQAFSLALNREELAKHVLKAGEAPAYGLTPPNTGGYTCQSRVGYDVEKARTLLAEAGYPNGQGLPLVEILYNTSEQHKTIAEAIQRMWKENLNADVKLLNQDWKVYLASMDSLDYSVARSAWIADVLDPVNFLECFMSKSGNNRTGWASPDYDAKIEQVYSEPDPVKRESRMQEAEALLLEGAPFTPIYFYTWKFLLSTEVKGLIPNPKGYIRWRDLSLEREDS